MTVDQEQLETEDSMQEVISETNAKFLTWSAQHLAIKTVPAVPTDNLWKPHENIL